MRRRVFSMWFPSILIIAMFTTGKAKDYNKEAHKLLSRFHLMADTPLSKDIGKLRRFKEELADFSKKMVPLAEHFAKAMKDGTQTTTPISNMTSEIREIITYSMNMDSLPTATSYFHMYMQNYDQWVSARLTSILLKLEMLSIDSRQLESLDVSMCSKYPKDIIWSINSYAGEKCLKLKFSPKVVSLLDELIASCKFASDTLTPEEEDHFNDLYFELYHDLDKKPHIDLSSFQVKMFLQDKKDYIYDNKVMMLEDLSKLFDARSIGTTIPSECLPMAAFVRYHFNKDIWLRIGDVVITHVFASKFVTHLCANITHYRDPEAAGRFVEDADKGLKDVYAVLTEQFESLVESTRLTTETELRSFVNGTSEFRPASENATEHR